MVTQKQKELIKNIFLKCTIMLPHLQVKSKHLSLSQTYSEHIAKICANLFMDFFSLFNYNISCSQEEFLKPLREEINESSTTKCNSRLNKTEVKCNQIKLPSQRKWFHNLKESQKEKETQAEYTRLNNLEFSHICFPGDT